jgi:hypothetical protein
VQFSPDLRERVATGEVTLSGRLVPFSSIADADADETDRNALRARAAHAGPVQDDTPVYRIEFRVIAETA